VIVVPESIRTFMAVAPPVKATGFPSPSVPVTPFSWTVKSTTPGKPSKPEATRSMVTRLP